MNTLGKRLRRARELKSLSQVDVFKKTGINNKTLSRYENDGTEPDAESIKRLAELYEVSTDWIIGVSDKEKKEVISEYRKKAIEEIQKMNEDEVNYFYELMKRIKK